MKKKCLVKFFSTVMSAVILCGVFSPMMASATASNTYISGLQKFFDNGNHAQLVDCPDAVYMEYAERLRTDNLAVHTMHLLGLIYGGLFHNDKIEPDKELYKQALLNIIRTYEAENAEAITQQNLLDDTKSLEDYLHDVADIGLSWLGAAGTNIKLGTGEGVIPEDVNLAVSIINQISKDTEDWAKGACTLKTTLQLYEKHDIFLRTVEINAKGALKEAASELRIDQSKVVKAHLRAYGDLAMDSAEDYAKLFVDGIWAEDWIDYIKAKLHFSIPKAFSQAFQGAALGVEIGKLVGNLSVGAENVLAYIVEIKAVHDVSVILENEMNSIMDILHKDSTRVTEADVQDYISYGNYLLGSRIRGQYCMTAIYLQPSLRTLFNKDEAKNAESLYNRLTNNLLNIKKELDAICCSGENDLAMYYLSIQSGQYAISGDYKYLTIINGRDGPEPAGDLYKVNITTGEKTLLKKDTLAQCINVVGDKVFYTLYGSGPFNVGVHMISTDGSGYRMLTDTFINSLVADESYVYFSVDPIAYEAGAIKRIAYTSELLSEDTIIPSTSTVYSLNLSNQKLIYAEVKSAAINYYKRRIVIYDLVSKSKMIINDGDDILENFETIWTHNEYVYILKWHGRGKGEGYGGNISEEMKRDLYRYNMSSGNYEICELPPASYEIMFDYYFGDIYSNILEDFEKELPTDFVNSAKYIFKVEGIIEQKND